MPTEVSEKIVCTLEVRIRSPYCLKVSGVMGELSFTGGKHIRRGGIDDFVFEGDEATLTEALLRLEAVKDAICVLQYVVEEVSAHEAQR